jgi:hypothetical protein
MRKYSGGIVLAVVAALAMTIFAYAQQSRSPREAQEAMRRHREQTRGTVTTDEALLQILRSQDVPGGIVVSPQCNGVDRHQMPVGLSLHELLDSLAAVAPQYMWQAKSGVINVIPRDRIPAFLEVRVARFRAEKVASPNEALAKLFETPEVLKAMTDPVIGSRLFMGSVGIYVPDSDAGAGIKSFSVSQSNVTVREVLNAISNSHGHAMWTHRQNNCRGVNSFELEFSVW